MHTSHLPIVAFFLLVLAFPFGSIAAQNETLTFTQGDTSCGASTVGICLTVENFDTISGIEHVIHWDPAVLNLSVSGATMDPSVASGGNFVFSSDSTLNFGWNSFTPRDFMNGDRLYCLVFDVVGTIPSTGTLVEQFELSDRPPSFPGPPNSIIVDITPRTNYIFNSVLVTPTSGSSMDVTSPTVTGCPTDITLTAPTGGSVIASWAAPTATDVCGVTSSSTHTSGSSFAAGTTTTVTYTFTDPSGNETPCAFDVIVNEDNSTGAIPPSLTLIQNTTSCTDTIVEICVRADSLFDLTIYSHVLGYDESVLEYQGVSSHATPNTPTIFSPSTGRLNVRYVEAAGQDLDGVNAYCLTFKIIGDISNGTIVRRIPESERGAIPPDQIQTSNGTFDEPDYVFNTPVTVMQTSGTGVDTQAPVINACPMDITQTVASGTTSTSVSWTAPTATDDCGTPMVTSTNAPGDSFSVGTTTVTYTFTDGAGNPATCTFDVTVSEDMPSNEGMASLEITGGTVNCGDNTLQICIQADSLFDIVTMSHVLVWDNSILSYRDSSLVNSAIMSNGSVVLSTDSTFNFGFNSISPATFNNDETLYCINFDVIGDISSGVTIQQFENADRPSNFPGPPNQIRNNDLDLVPYTFTNISVSAADQSAPIFANFPMDRDTFLTADCEASVSWVEPTATDDCDMNVMVSGTHTSGDIFPVGSTDVIYTAQDQAGNITMDTFNITVLDTIPPSLQDCPMDVTLTIAPTSMDTTYSWTAPNATDNCPGSAITTDVNPGSTFPIGTTTVTYTVTDASGNMNTCSFDVIVQPEGPEMECPADVTVSAIGSACQATLTAINVSVTGGTASTITYELTGATVTSSPPTGLNNASITESFNLGVTTVTYTVTDVNNNSTSCSFEVTVEDTDIPVIECPTDVSITIPLGIADTMVTGIGLGIALDNCTLTDSLTASYELSGATTVSTTMGNDASGTSFNVGTTLVAYTLTDQAGNDATCSFNVVVRNPDIGVECPNDTIVVTTVGECDATISNLSAIVLPHPDSVMHVVYNTTGATSLMSPTTGINDISMESFNLGVTMVTYTVIDGDDNSATCTFNVTVEDTDIPVIECPTDVSITIPLGIADTMITGIGLGIALDNCTTTASLTASYELTGATTASTTMGDDASGTSFNVGTTLVTYTLTDEAGNDATCSFNVVVRNPDVGIECPNDTTVVTVMGECDAAIGNLSAMVTPHPDSAMHVLYNTTGATSLMSPTTGINDISDETFNTGITNITYTVIGNQNDTVRCDFVVTVQDTFPPTFTCPDDVTVMADSNMGTAVVSGIALQNLTDCDPTTTVNYTLSGATNATGSDDASGTVFNTDVTTVTYFVTDNSGNRDSCSFLVIVEELPVQLTCPADVMLTVTSDTICAAVVTNIAATVADTAALASLTYMTTGATALSSDTMGINDISGETFNVGATNVTYTATDTLGNMVNCSFNVIVEDSQDLFITCPDDLILFVGVDDTTAVAGDLSPLAFGYPCTQNDSFELTYLIGATPMGAGNASGQTFELGSTVVTYTIQDTIGNFEQCTFSVRVRQESPVRLSCPEDMILSNEIDLCSATIDTLLSVDIDAGLIDTMTLTLSGALTDSIVADTLLDLSGTTFPIGETMVTYTVVDTLGFTNTCSFTITVNDDQRPTLECPDDLILIAGEDETEITVNNNLALLGFDDNCGNNNLSVNYTLTGATMASDTVNATGEVFNVGITTVTYTVEDSSGNSATCSFDVEIAAADDLAIDCPEDLENVSASPNSCTAQIGGLGVDILSPDSIIQSIVYGLRGATVADSSPNGINDASLEIFNIGTTTVTYIVTDTLGRVETCSFLVTVEDNTGPRIQCPQDVVVNIPFADSTSIVNNIALLVAQDNCDPNPVITYELTGATVGAGMGDASGEIFNLGDTRVTYTVTDAEGLASICFFDVTIGQFGLMFENCPTEDFVLQVDTTECGVRLDTINVSVSPLASVASLSYTLSGATVFQSPIDSVAFADSTFFNVGTTTVIYTAVDVIGEVRTCEFDVVVEDDIAPIFVNCPDSMVVAMDTQECFATVSWTVPEIIEGCEFIMTPPHTPGSEIELQMMAGDTTITYVATDVNGNVSTCSFQIRVEDQQLPNYIFCPETEEDYTVIQSDTICGAVVTWSEPQNFDNCGIVSSTQTHTPGDIFPYGTTTVTYMAFDEAGNAGMCEFEVFVADSIPVSLIDCPMDTTITLMEGDSTSIVDWTVPSVGGTCGDFILESNFMPGDTFSEGMTTVTYIATDTLAMNSDTCSFVITIEIDSIVVVEMDTIPPVFADCPSDIISPLDDGECSATVSWTEPTATDNIGVDSLFASHMPGDVFQIGTTEVMYIAIDSTGNRDTCAFDITVEGPQNSVLLCPANVTVIAPVGVCGSAVDWIPPTIERPCSDMEISIVSDFTPGSLFPVGATEVTYIASDMAGYADTCSFTITVLDQELPVFSACLEDVILSVEPGSCEANFDWTPPTATDNCGIADFSASHQPPFSFPVGETTVSYTAVDISGNANNCQFIVRVVDDSAPAFASCPDTVMVRADGTIISDPSGVITTITSTDCSSVQLSFTEPSANDDCSDAVVAQTDNTGLSSGSTFQPGTTTLTYTATDGSDNVATCELVIVVEGVGTGAVEITVDNPVACVGEDVEITAGDLGIPGATYVWTLPDGSTFSGIVLTIIDIPTSLSGTHIVNVTTPTGCTFTNSVEVTVEEAPTLSVSHNSEEVVCGGGTVDLVFTAASNDDIVSWSWVGPNGFESDLQNPVILNANASDSGNYIVTATTANGCTSEEMTSVSIRERPTLPTLQLSGGNGLGMDGVTNIGCSLDTFNLIGAEYEGDVQYIWNVTPNNFGFAPGNTNIAQAIIPDAGDYTFEYSVLVDGCPSDTVSVTMNIESQPIIETSILGATSCVNADSSIVLQANGQGVIAWEWFRPDGGSLEMTQSVTITGLSENLSGTYRVVGTTVNGCTAEATLEVTLSNQLEMPIVGDLGSVCDGDELIINLGGNYPENTMFTWVSDSTALNFMTSDSDFDTGDLAPGIYNASITANGGGCESTSTEIQFVILARPSVSLPNAALTFDCIATDTTIQFTDMGEGGSKWFWFSSQGMFTSSEQNPEYTITYEQTPLTDTVYVQVTGENGCMATDSLIVSFNQGVPQPVIVGSARYCMGEELVLRLRDELPDSTIYTWKGPNGFISGEPIVNIEGVSTAQDGIFQVCTQVGECLSAPSDSFTVTVITPPTLEDDGYVVFEGTADTLNITSNDNLVDNVTFSLGLLSEPFRGEVSLQGGVVTYTAPMNEVGGDNFSYEICYDACDDPNLLLCDDALVTISVQYPPEQCVITTLVTPNNDGNNDNLIISCVDGGVYPEHELFIFNQWGDEVFQAAPYNNDWNGTFNDAPLPSGTYFYVFIPEPGAEAQKGFISLYR